VGQKIAAELLLQGREFSGEEAQKWQIINEVVEDPKARAQEIAVEISAQPPNALIQAKQLMKSADHEKLNLIMAAEGELFQKALTSEEAQTAFMNFLAKKG
jgi:enoyl-CoA hydratase/carnithine racemase